MAKNSGNHKPRVKEKFDREIIPALMEELKFSSRMAVPRLEKIVINTGVAQGKENIQEVEQAREDLSLICGQLPQVRRAKKSISNFKLRQGMPIGVRVTLRGHRMYEFFDRFVSIAVPRIRDFQGFGTDKFDGNGNLNIGLSEHHIFSEVNAEKSPRPMGMNITFVTTARDDKSARALFECLGMPFRKPRASGTK